MKKSRHYVTFGFIFLVFLSFVISLSTLNSCATLNALVGLTRAQFKIQDAVGYRLSGVDITNKHSLTDFSLGDGLNMMNSFRTGKFPLTFTINVAVKNPNQHQAGSGLSSLSLSEFPWRLMLDGKETITGGIGSPVYLPDGGATTTIPLQVSVDLKEFFADKGYDGVIGLALAIAGQGSSKITLKAQPTISTPIGSMKYPNELTIVNTEFRN